MVVDPGDYFRRGNGPTCSLPSSFCALLHSRVFSSVPQLYPAWIPAYFRYHHPLLSTRTLLYWPQTCWSDSVAQTYDHQYCVVQRVAPRSDSTDLDLQRQGGQIRGFPNSKQNHTC